MACSSFDEKDLNRYYFSNLKKEDAFHILIDEEEGCFLVRNSSRDESYVICVKEQKTVSQYPTQRKDGKIYVRPEFPFEDLPSLVSFYKYNKFTHTGLMRPVSLEKVKCFQQDVMSCAGDRKTDIPTSFLASSGYFDATSDSASKKTRASAPPEVQAKCPPVYGKVIKPRQPISYAQAQSELAIKVGDIIHITSRKNGVGQGEILESGKKGSFPLTHVELIDGLELNNFVQRPQ